jgi:hypothetical protein
VAFFSDCLPDTIWIARRNGVTEKGDPSYDTAVQIPCRFQDDASNDGSEVDNVSTVYFDQKVTPLDRVWSPGTAPGDNVEPSTPTGVRKSRGLDGGDALWKVDL